MELKTADLCTDEGEIACTFVAAIEASPTPLTPHPTAEQYTGWKHMSGVCRADDPAGDGLVQINGKYSEFADGVGGHATQKECKDHCEGEKDCLGYAHKENGDCIIYGPGLDVTDLVWTADSHSITGPIGDKTMHNVEYICGVKLPPVAKPDVMKESESCRPGAMLALALWLTRLWQ
jgi:hypothetical protein